MKGCMRDWFDAKPKIYFKLNYPSKWVKLNLNHISSFTKSIQ